MNQPFGFTPGDQPKFDINSLGEMLQQIGAMMQRADSTEDNGAVSWTTIRETARSTIFEDSDSSILDSQKTAATQAMQLAQTWVDAVTSFPTNTTTLNSWSRSEWLEATIPAWQPLIDPVAEGMQRTMVDLNQQLPAGMEVPAEMKAMLEPIMAMAKKMAAVSTGMQIGKGLGALSAELLAASDIPVALTPNCEPAVFPNAISKFAADYGLPVAEAMLFICVREAAFQRLMAANPWLQREVGDLVASYARGIEFDADRIQELMGQIDPADPSSMQELLESGAFEPTRTAAQERALQQLEFRLALVEGWVQLLAQTAVAGRLEAATALGEIFVRRQISGGPTGKAFANLVGLQLDTVLIRKALLFWQDFTEQAGSDKRDWVWTHPDLLPSKSDFQDPHDYFAALKNENE
jgi:putative hydrolase